MENMHYILGTILIVSSLLKIVDWKGFAETYSKYDVVAKQSRAYAYGYPIAELLLGMLYFIYARGAILSFVTLLLISVSLFSIIKRFSYNQSLRFRMDQSLIAMPLPAFVMVQGVVMTLLAVVILFAF